MRFKGPELRGPTRGGSSEQTRRTQPAARASDGAGKGTGARGRITAPLPGRRALEPQERAARAPGQLRALPAQVLGSRRVPWSLARPCRYCLGEAGCVLRPRGRSILTSEDDGLPVVWAQLVAARFPDIQGVILPLLSSLIQGANRCA